MLAGLTAATIVIPKAMAYATIAGLPLQVGLYTAIVPMLVYALFGASRVLSVSTTTTIAILTAAELGRAAPGGDASTLLTAAATLARAAHAGALLLRVALAPLAHLVAPLDLALPLALAGLVAGLVPLLAVLPGHAGLRHVLGLFEYIVVFKSVNVTASFVIVPGIREVSDKERIALDIKEIASGKPQGFHNPADTSSLKAYHAPDLLRQLQRRA